MCRCGSGSSGGGGETLGICRENNSNSGPGSLLPSCVITDKLLNFSQPQSPLSGKGVVNEAGRVEGNKEDTSSLAWGLAQSRAQNPCSTVSVAGILLDSESASTGGQLLSAPEASVRSPRAAR